ncbi:ATP-binding protein [Mycoplasmatota bacterium]|nr:ATP-binding protein [Mycoplasmatota bacterium]
MLKVKNYKIIREAEIKVDGIVVLAGKNNTGKSTISDCMYYSSIKESLGEKDFMADLSNYCYERIKEVTGFTRSSILRDNKKLKDFYSRFDDFLLNLTGFMHPEDIYKSCKSFREHTEIILRDVLGLEKNRSSKNRLYRSTFLNYKDIFEELMLFIEESDFDEFVDKYADSLHSTIFPEGTLPRFNNLIMSERNYKQTLSFGNGCKINNAIYVKSPVLWAENSNRNRFDENPTLHLIKKNKTDYLSYLTSTKKTFSSIYGEDKEIGIVADFVHEAEKIIEGSLFLDKNNEIKFTNKFGNEFTLNEMGTGFSNFAILLLLIQHNQIDENTLIIFDEPESHLHTLWQYDIGRLFVLMHKYFKCPIFINSHSSLIIESIESNSEEQAIEANYYLTSRNKDGSYTVENKTDNINEIYRELSRASRKIKYG